MTEPESQTDHATIDNEMLQTVINSDAFGVILDSTLDWISGSSPTRSTTSGSGRRTKQNIEALKAHLYEITQEIQPASVRQIYYQMVSRGFIDKTETEYKGTVCRLLTIMRKAGELPYGWITDTTRMMRKPNSYRDLDQWLEHEAALYRRALWDNQAVDVEIWLEKDALSGVLYPITSRWDVPLMVTRGYPSLTFVHSAAHQMNQTEWPTHIYYLGDHDPSGQDIPRMVEENLREMAPKADITFTRLAVNPDQIELLNLPTRPTKKKDSRSKGFIGESVEVDAIEPEVLRRMVEDAITSHINQDALDYQMEVEALERETLSNLPASWSRSDS